MRTTRLQRPYTVVLKYPNGVTRSITVMASSREVAERRALKRNPAALHVQRNP